MKIAPSVLAADLSDLASAVEVCEQGGADLVHLDVMDGHFVPNLTFGFPVIDALAKRTDVPFDIHLMVERPGELMDHYLACKPRWVSFHWEAGGHADRLVHQIKDAGSGAGIALNPATPIDVLTDVLEKLDFVLLMSVNPGFAGQPFVDYVLDKCRRLRAEIERRGLYVEIEMDGGITLANAEQIRDAGCTAAVVGSGIYKAEDPVAMLKALRSLPDPASQESA
ncbi:MAG: ribulose-phosphate 3-epimerase [Acidobacteriota bacterium]